MYEIMHRWDLEANPNGSRLGQDSGGVKGHRMLGGWLSNLAPIRLLRADQGLRGWLEGGTMGGWLPLPIWLGAAVGRCCYLIGLVGWPQCTLQLLVVLVIPITQEFWLLDFYICRQGEIR